MSASLDGLWPAWVDSYDGGSRTCRVRIDGVTDGSVTMPEAVFNNPLGDNAATTEIRVQAGDPVWVMFECGDPRFPIITGYRTPRATNPIGWRRWAHENIELTADNQLVINADSVVWNVKGSVTENIGGAKTTKAESSELTATTATITANTSIVGGLSSKAGAGGGGVSFEGPSVTHNGTNIGETHSHKEQGDGNDVGPPH